MNFNENFLLFSRLPFARLNFEKEKKNFPRSRMETRCDRKFPTTTTKQHFNLNKFIFFLFEINRERNTCALQSLYIFLLLLLSCCTATPYFGSTGPNPGLTCYDVIRLPTSQKLIILRVRSFVRFLLHSSFPITRQV